MSLYTGGWMETGNASGSVMHVVFLEASCWQLPEAEC